MEPNFKKCLWVTIFNSFFEFSTLPNISMNYIFTYLSTIETIIDKICDIKCFSLFYEIFTIDPLFVNLNFASNKNLIHWRNFLIINNPQLCILSLHLLMCTRTLELNEYTFFHISYVVIVIKTLKIKRYYFKFFVLFCFQFFKNCPAYYPKNFLVIQLIIGCTFRDYQCHEWMIYWN